MKSLFFAAISALVLSVSAPLSSTARDNVITMSTTTSTEASGLLDYLLPEFHKDTGITVRVLAKGTGAALRDGMDGNADVVFVHDVDREEQFVADGYGTRRYYVMYNDFIIVGPESDSAGIKDASGAVEAFNRIAAAKAPFISRGDDSGTHGRERQIWAATGLALNDVKSPLDGRGWYFSIGQGMGQALIFAQEKLGYTLADRGTYLQYKFGRPDPYELEIAYEDDDMLRNPYGVIPVNPERYPHVKYDMAETFAKWLVSERGQRAIGSFKLLGQPLFFPDAKKALH